MCRNNPDAGDHAPRIGTLAWLALYTQVVIFWKGIADLEKHEVQDDQKNVDEKFEELQNTLSRGAFLKEYWQITDLDVVIVDRCRLLQCSQGHITTP